MDKARRYNKNKSRYELIPTTALEKLAEVYTKGAEKYTLRDEEGKIIEDGSDNWRKGLSWMSCIASVQRHIEAFKKGEDLDPEIGTYHLANAAWGLFTILEYYKIYPQGDNRPHTHLKHPKIGLDIDNVICDWTKGWGDHYGCNTRPNCWNFSYLNKERFTETPKPVLHDFYGKIPRQVEPADIPFEPHCYLTARSIDEEVTKKWIEDNGFPCVPVYTVPFGASKVEIAKKVGIEWFIDDSFSNFVELNNAGICTFLMDTAHNQRYDVGYRRIKDFKDFKDRFLT